MDNYNSNAWAVSSSSVANSIFPLGNIYHQNITTDHDTTNVYRIDPYTRRVKDFSGRYIDIELVCLIGPMGSGKDYRAKEYEKNGYAKVSFADYLRSTCWNLLLWKPEDEEQYRKFKEEPFGPSSITGREFMFSVESLLKECHGDSIFARRTVELIVHHYSNKIVISDLRFESEYKTIINTFANVKFIFCNYKSDHYELRKIESEKMAVRFAEIGYRDGQELNEKDFENLWKKPEELL